MKTLILMLALISNLAFAEKLSTIVTIEDGLNNTTNKTISDDYIRLHLHEPSYPIMALIDQKITDWLGPQMTRIEDKGLILVQAPRDPNARIQFISALLNLDIPND